MSEQERRNDFAINPACTLRFDPEYLKLARQLGERLTMRFKPGSRRKPVRVEIP